MKPQALLSSIVKHVWFINDFMLSKIQQVRKPPQEKEKESVLTPCQKQRTQSVLLMNLSVVYFTRNKFTLWKSTRGRHNVEIKGTQSCALSFHKVQLKWNWSASKLKEKKDPSEGGHQPAISRSFHPTRGDQSPGFCPGARAFYRPTMKVFQLFKTF